VTELTDRRNHWNRVYESKTPESVSWYQRKPELSLALIAASGVAREASIIDIGGGESVLVDHLLDLGYAHVAVLDLSGSALRASQARLGVRAAGVEWHEADVTAFVPPHRYALWHDRAVFHFLTAAEDRASYAATLRSALEQNGAVVIATFAPDGPPKCSGLDVMRHDEKSIAAELGAGFRLLEVRRETHLTPWQAEQPFNYFRFERQAD
jgi:trans-aconitate methyltransferase